MPGFNIDNDRPTEVDLSGGTLEEKGLPIPQVRDLTMTQSAFQPPQDEEEEEVELVSESEDSGQDAEEEVPSLETHGNPWARARILKGERRERDEQIEELSQRLAEQQRQFEAFFAAVQEANKSALPQKDPDDIDLDNIDDTNIVETMFKAMKSIKEEIKSLKNTSTQAIERSTDSDKLTQANAVIITQFQKDPAFRAGISHLSNTLKRTTKRNFPNASEEERARITAEAFDKKKIEWVRNGLDPVEQMMEYAIDYGFNPYQHIMGEPTRKKETPKDTLRREKERLAGVTSLGGSEGAPPKTLTARQFKQMDENEFNYTVNRAIESGSLREGNKTIGRTPSFKDLLPGKAKLAK